MSLLRRCAARMSRVEMLSEIWGALAVTLVLVLLCPVWVAGAAPNDEQCLRDFKSSVGDPTGYLANWVFTTPLRLCGFTGVQCLHQNDTVYTLKLPGASLRGSFPTGLAGCASLTSLDLSSNQFTGPIPQSLCEDNQYLVTVTLNDNQFSGSIPDMVNCTYLNDLYLQDNRLTGLIPASIGSLARIAKLNVSRNNLEGVIPSTVGSKFNDESAFADNPHLCGPPLNTLTSCFSAKSNKKNSGLIVGIAIGAAVALIAVVGLGIWWWFLSRPVGYSRGDENRWIKRIKAPKSIIVSMFEKPLVKIKLSDLMAATNDFSQGNIIAQGRTGTVYKGTLSDGSVMAIKRLQVTPHSDRQFRAEMETLGRLKHRNLVPLLGYCVAGQERLLVYKHMPNGSLQDHLRGTFKGMDDQVTIDTNYSVNPEKGQEMTEKLDWETRLKIAIGGARGLAWLHHSCNPRVIHRNISPSSILLDEEFEAKISDFGLARLMNPVDTHISTFINGDFGDVGYVAPEYVRTLVATVKGDVYSFGVVILELITGKKAMDVSEENFRGNLAEWISFLTHTGNVSKAIDKSLLTGAAGQEDELLQFLKIGASCVVPNPKERPSMYEIFHMLRAIGEKYHFTDESDEIPIASTTEAEPMPELIVSKP